MHQRCRSISILLVFANAFLALGQQTIRCSSDNGQRNVCRADVRGTVRLTRQISGPPCIRDKTWGVQRDGIWVDRGCRADFAIIYSAPPAPVRPGAGQTLRCSSNSGNLQLCRVNTRGGVRLVKQISGTPCIQDKTWGVSREGIWVDRGCRADFLIGQGGVGVGPGPGPRPR
jgi:Protein of unknown function (DUF3011)